MRTMALALAAGVIAFSAQQPAVLNLAAPEFTAGQWLNTAKNKPASLASRRGKVTIVEFWTFG
jgi:hypothetical protein